MGLYRLIRIFDKVLFSLYAVILEKIGKLVELEELCKKRLSKNPREYLANHYLARSLRKQGKFEQAVGVYRVIIGFKSGFFSNTFDLIWALYESGKYAEVVRVGQEALYALHSLLRPIDRPLKNFYFESIHRLIGNSHVALGNLEEAVPHLALASERPQATDREQIRKLLEKCRDELQRRQGNSWNSGDT